MKLELRDASLTYSNAKVNVLTGVNLRIESEKVAIVGSNGSGKTTIINGIMGLAETTDGTIRVLDIDINKEAGRILGVACNLDVTYRLLDLPVKQEIEVYCSMTGVDPTSVLRHIERYDLLDILPKRMRVLSTGQNKAFSNIMALELGYKLTLLDEPFESLDVRRRRMMIDDLNNFQGSVLINTHDFSALKSLPNWGLYIIIDGKLYGKLNSSDINRLYLAKGEVASALSTIRTSYGTFCITLDKGDVPLSTSTDLVNLIGEVVG
ncbi:MAG: ATP-binding cassette domain-containing protein [Candidatus Thermoplasmatota archaeon]|jgi:ABC-type multidrug transport system ATPase subunit|nr:ATP-binding cassette domain-containing protein [Candidatus Thermoplasmatota archaeon]MCL5800183.1 ATP-binding cassette domain-containing protein [Candidatus Thermoplasmatota archaeon]